MFVTLYCEGSGHALSLVTLGTWAARLRGLLGTGPDADPVMLMRCGSVHTFGMRYPLDVAFIGERGEVLRSLRALAPGRIASRVGSVCVLERPASDEPWPEEGERVVVGRMAMPHFEEGIRIWNEVSN